MMNADKFPLWLPTGQQGCLIHSEILLLWSAKMFQAVSYHCCCSCCSCLLLLLPCCCCCCCCPCCSCCCCCRCCRPCCSQLLLWLMLPLLWAAVGCCCCGLLWLLPLQLACINQCWMIIWSALSACWTWLTWVRAVPVLWVASTSSKPAHWVVLSICLPCTIIFPWLL